MTLQILINSKLYDLMLRSMLNMTLKILINSKLYDLMLRSMLTMTLQILINSKLYDLMLRSMLIMTLQILINSKLYDLVLRAMLNMTLQILRHRILLDKKFHFHTTILPWLKFLVDGSEFLVDGGAWNLIKITAKTLLSCFFACGGVMDDANFTSTQQSCPGLTYSTLVKLCWHIVDTLVLLDATVNLCEDWERARTDCTDILLHLFLVRNNLRSTDVGSDMLWHSQLRHGERVMDDAKNKIYLERGPRAEWGPGSVRAPIKSFNLEPCTRTQDPFHSEDPFQRKLCSNSLPSTRNFTSTQQSCPGLSFLWMEVNFLWMEVPGSTLF